MNNLTDVILLASGSSSRMGLNKLYLPLGNLTVIEKTLDVFYNMTNMINSIILVYKEDDKNNIDNLLSKYPNDKKIKLVIGGRTRSESVLLGLGAVGSENVLIHDGARPFVTSNLIQLVIQSVNQYGSGVPALAITDSIRKVINGKIVDYPDRNNYFNVQTPQGFKTKDIIKAYNLATEGATDDAELYGKYIGAPLIVNGEQNNIKLTTYNDYFGLNANIGVGYDVHQLALNIPLVLGGVNIPFNYGLVAHSDGDVLVHAIMDAILSALGERDIGYHFSDKDPQYKNIKSTELLKIVTAKMKSKNLKIHNLSATIVAEKPKLTNYIPLMISNLADILEVNVDDIAIHATTSEGLGVVGEGKGIVSFAVATLL